MSDPELASARYLQRAGQWDAALRLLPDDQAGRDLRAEILVDRHLWRLDDPAEALTAVKAVADPALATLLTAQVEYWRRLVRGGEGEPLSGDPVDAFESLLGDPSGWADFWHAVAVENLREDAETAAAGYARALTASRENGDPLLESYAVRHQAWHAYEIAGDTELALTLNRRSLYLRAALGVRPQTAAAMRSLADMLNLLGRTAEAAQLIETATASARELGMSWLIPGE